MQKMNYKYEDLVSLVKFALNDDLPVFNTTDEIVDEWIATTKQVKSSKSDKIEKEVSNWIDAWVNLFPVGVKNQAGKLLRMDKKSCLNKMIQFVKDYPEYSRELIFEATESYLDIRAEDDYKYARAAIYFIGKRNEGSDLASTCDAILLEDDTNKVDDYKTQKRINSEFI